MKQPRKATLWHPVAGLSGHADLFSALETGTAGQGEQWHPRAGQQRQTIDSALFGQAAVLLTREKWTECDRKFIALIVVLSLGFAGKLGYEFFAAATIFVDSSAAGFTPVPPARAVGVGIGVLRRRGQSQRLLMLATVSRISIARVDGRSARGVELQAEVTVYYQRRSKPLRPGDARRAGVYDCRRRGRVLRSS